MPSSTSPTSRESQAAIVTALISTDPEMRNVAREFVLMGLREMLNQLTRGDAATKATIAKSMSGVVANLFTQQTADDGLTDLRDEMHQMMSEVRGDLGAHEDRDSEPTTESLVDAHRVMVPKS